MYWHLNRRSLNCPREPEAFARWQDEDAQILVPHLLLQLSCFRSM